MSEREGQTGGYAGWAGPRAAVALAVGLFVLRAVYLVWLCPYALIEDEAQYWEWSRRPDWSYYSKGPGVAWAIGASTLALGDAEWAVRMPSAAAMLVVSLAAAGLARELSRDRRAPFLAVAAVNLVPLLQGAGILMTIDMPYAACWTVAAWAFWRAVVRGSGPMLVGAALALGAGFLFKYTALLLIPGLAVFVPLARGRGLRVPGAGWWAASALVFGACAAPVVWWNWAHGWPTVKHLLGHVRAAGGDRPVAQGEGGRYSVKWTLEYVGAQIGLAGPVVWLALAEFLAARRARREDPERWTAAQYLVLCAAPLLVFYLGVTFVAPVQQNWVLAAYTTLGVLATVRLGAGMDEFRERLRAWRGLPEPRPRAGFLLRRPETGVQVLWHMTLGYGIIAAVGIARVDLIGMIPGLRAVVPVHRLMGAGQRGAQVAGLVSSLRERTGMEPFVLAHHYGMAAQMAYYMPGRPVVYCSSAYTGGRRTQYDYFEDTDLERVMPALIGRPAVTIGATEPQWRDVFGTVEPLGKLDGDKKDDRPAFVCTDFRGFPVPRPAP